MEQLRGSLIASGQIIEDDDGTATPPPKGRAKAYGSQTKQGGSAGYEDPTINLIFDLYNIMQSKTASEEEKAEADRRINDLFSQLEKGPLARPRSGSRRDLSIESATHCFKCGRVIGGAQADAYARGSTPCPECGHVVGSQKTLKRPFLQPR